MLPTKTKTVFGSRPSFRSMIPRSGILMMTGYFDSFGLTRTCPATSDAEAAAIDPTTIAEITAAWITSRKDCATCRNCSFINFSCNSLSAATGSLGGFRVERPPVVAFVHFRHLSIWIDLGYDMSCEFYLFSGGGSIERQRLAFASLQRFYLAAHEVDRFRPRLFALLERNQHEGLGRYRSSAWIRYGHRDAPGVAGGVRFYNQARDDQIRFHLARGGEA